MCIKRPLRRWLGLVAALLPLLLIALPGPSAHAATVALDTQVANFDLSDKLSLLADPTGEYHFTEVAEMHGEFRVVARRDLLQSFNAGVFWLRFSLVHSGAQPVTRWLVVGSSKIQQVTLFMHSAHEGPGQADWQVMHAGRAVPRIRKPVIATDPVFPVTMAPGENREFLLRVEVRGASDLATALWEPQAYRLAAGESNLMRTGIMGGILLGALLALFVFVRLRGSSYLWLGLMLGAIVALEATRENLVGLYFWPEDWAFPPQVLAVVAGVAVFALTKVVSAALELPRAFPWGNRLIMAIRWGGVLAVAFSFADYGTGIRLLSLLVVILLPASLLLATLAWRRGQTSAGTFTLAFALALLVEMMRQLANLGVLPWAAAMNFSMAGFLLSTPLILLGMVEQTRQLSEKLAVAEQLQQAKSAFLARVSHELRSPLNTILGFARMLQRGSARLSLDEGTRGIEKGALRLLALIDELLDESRAAAGKLTVAPAPIFFDPWLDEICVTAMVACETQGNRFSSVRSGNLPASVAVAIDGQRLRQVLENLLSNANRHTQQGEIRLECHAEIEAETAVLSFAVQDTGEGIAPPHLATIFEPFVRGEEAKIAQREKRAGFGLGLSICRELVRQMGGEIAVKSTLGRGSCFSFTLHCPLVMPPVAAVRRAIPGQMQAPNQAPANEGGPRVLLVDDYPLQLEFLSDLLEEAGFVTQTAACGEVAADLFRTQHWDAVITDQMMAHGDGWYLLRQVRSHAAGGHPVPAHIPVLLLSAALPQRPDDFPDDIDFDAFLRKPALSEDLLATLWALVLNVGAGGTAPTAGQWQALATLAGDGDVSGIEDWIAALDTAGTESPPVVRWARAAINRLDLDVLQRSAMIALCPKK